MTEQEKKVQQVARLVGQLADQVEGLAEATNRLYKAVNRLDDELDARMFKIVWDTMHHSADDAETEIKAAKATIHALDQAMQQ